MQNKITRETFALKKINIKNEKQCQLIMNEISLTQLSKNENVVSYFESYQYNGSL